MSFIEGFLHKIEKKDYQRLTKILIFLKDLYLLSNSIDWLKKNKENDNWEIMKC